MIRHRRTLIEFGIVLAAVVAVQAHACGTQARIQVNGGKGYDGDTYYSMANELAAGERPDAESRFVRRLGTPFLAALVDSEDLLNGFLIANVAATVIASVLLLIWFRMHLRSPWLRVALVVLYATHWLQLVRFTFFYPALVDAWAQVAGFAGLICISWYERKPGRWPVVALSVISLAGVFFRELVLLVPLAFLFARNPRLEHLRTFPYLRVPNFPRFEQWIPLGLASAAAAFVISALVIVNDAEFSASAHLTGRAFDRNLSVYVLGWFVAFGPLLFVVLFDWRSAVQFLSTHRAFLVYILGVGAIAWAGSLESERHALNSASPIVYLLLGRTIERHEGWFRSPALVGLLLGAQALVHRLFLSTPQPREDYLDLDRFTVLFTPIGSDVTYLHLFPSYVPQEMVVIQLAEFAGLGAVVLFWMSRRAQLSTADEGTRERRGAMQEVTAAS